ncbi:MAG: hypothetical protein KKF54_02715, partial [Candidatus Omnitrophica bacterium]|nr:hypothetical protein [Candidatus Omnitrophota bacterium]
MKLQQIFPELSLESKTRELNAKGISRDSRRLLSGDLFFVIEGKTFDIFSVLLSIEGKVSVFVCDVKNKRKINSIIKRKPVIFVKNINKEFYKAVDNFYRLKNDKLRFVGVTGTNGKTTTSHFI